MYFSISLTVSRGQQYYKSSTEQEFDLPYLTDSLSSSKFIPRIVSMNIALNFIVPYRSLRSIFENKITY